MELPPISMEAARPLILCLAMTLTACNQESDQSSQPGPTPNQTKSSTSATQSNSNGATAPSKTTSIRPEAITSEAIDLPREDLGIDFDPFEIEKTMTEAWNAQDYEKTQLLFIDWLSKDEGSALAYLLDQVEPANAAHFSGSLREYLGRIDTDAQLAILMEVQDRRELLVSAAVPTLTKVAAEDPNYAHSVLDSIEDELATRELAFKLAERGAFGRGESTIETLNQLPEGLATDTLIEAATKSWLHLDGAAATNYINQTENPFTYLPGVTRYINESIARNPQGIMEWAQLFENEDFAQEAVDIAGQRWLELDPSGYQTWEDAQFSE